MLISVETNFIRYAGNSVLSRGFAAYSSWFFSNKDEVGQAEIFVFDRSLESDEYIETIDIGEKVPVKSWSVDWNGEEIHFKELPIDCQQAIEKEVQARKIIEERSSQAVWLMAQNRKQG